MKWIFMEADPAVLWYVPFYKRIPCWNAPQAWLTYIVFPKSPGSMRADAMFKRLTGES